MPAPGRLQVDRHALSTISVDGGAVSDAPLLTRHVAPPSGDGASGDGAACVAHDHNQEAASPPMPPPPTPPPTPPAPPTEPSTSSIRAPSDALDDAASKADAEAPAAPPLRAPEPASAPSPAPAADPTSGREPTAKRDAASLSLPLKLQSLAARASMPSAPRAPRAASIAVSNRHGTGALDGVVAPRPRVGTMRRLGVPAPRACGSVGGSRTEAPPLLDLRSLRALWRHPMVHGSDEELPEALERLFRHISRAHDGLDGLGLQTMLLSQENELVDPQYTCARPDAHLDHTITN